METTDIALLSLATKHANFLSLDKASKVERDDIGHPTQDASLAAIVGAIHEGFSEIAKSILATQVPAVQPKALSAEQAAEYLGIKSTTLEYLVKVRRIRYVQVCDQRGRVFRIEDLDDFLQANTQLTASELLQKRGRR